MSKICRSAVFLLLLFLLPTTVAAQARGTLQGRVVDLTSGQPIVGAEVAIATPRLSAVTDEAGRYLMLNVPVGDYTVTATVLGYRTEERQATITAGATTSLSFALAQTALR